MFYIARWVVLIRGADLVEVCPVAVDGVEDFEESEERK